MDVTSPPAVLIVDDLPANLVALEALLAPLPLTVVTALSGTEALKVLMTQEFAVILLDVQMPSMDGFELATLIRSRDRFHTTPIIFVTANDMPADRLIQGYRLGAIDFLVKPLVPEVVQAKVAAFVELYRLREELSALTHQRDLILNTLHEGIFGLDTQGRVTFVNQAAATMTGWSAHELQHQSMHQLIHHTYPDGLPYPELACPILLTIRNRRAQTITNEVFWRKDGTFFPVRYTSRPVYHGDVVVGAVVTFVDITQYSQLEAELQATQLAYSEMEQALRLRNQFLSVATHEIRTPITSMLGYAQLLQRRFAREQTLNERDQRAFDSLVAQVQRLHELTNGLLDLSGLQSGKQQLDTQPLDVGLLARELIEEQRLINERHSFVVSAPPAPVMIAADQVRLRQILSNLLSNAVKYSPDGGTVQVQVIQEPSTARILVQDEGIGIPADALPKLFQLFYRADNARTQNIVGVGVGLVVVRELVVMHGGTIEVESEEGQGTTFVLTFPLHTVGEPQEAHDDPQLVDR